MRYYSPTSRHVEIHPRLWRDETKALRSFTMKAYGWGIVWGFALGTMFGAWVLK